MTDRDTLEQVEAQLDGAAMRCLCKVTRHGASFVLLPEHMRDDCPIHGSVPRETLDRVAGDRGPWKQSYTGRAIYVLDPRPEDVFLVDIAHALALTCRFGGHCSGFYSVAQHSVLVSRLVEEHLAAHTEGGVVHRLAAAMWGLMHDAAEAYCGDIVAPIKILPLMGSFRVIEMLWQQAVAVHFALPDDMPEVVHWADRTLLATEARDLMAPPPQAWQHLPEPLPDTITPAGPMVAERMFLDRFAVLTARLGEARKASEAP